MMQTMKRSLALFIVLIMCVALVPALHLNVNATEVNYVYSGSYVYNWGTRGTVATFLSPNAKDFYEDNNTSYTELSSYSGGTGKSDAPQSALYDVLQDLMVSNHSYITSYSATTSLYKYTDCQNNGSKISSFYSGKEIGPAWDSGSTWNREHTWPNSKGLGGSDENDIMMLRPTATSENSSRGNTAYGKSGGYYNPNSESGGKYDLRGDVARIFLYVYVRWGNINKAWGTTGVMESVEVLLEWMEADPVDTWELGRNDSVESITGTRNVFVDYPEFAFILFGAEIPADMSTPSGEASGDGKDCGHNNFDAGVVTAPTCDKKGYTTYTCQTAGCGYSYKGNATPALGHTYVSGTCSICGEAEPSVPKYVTEVEVGKAYKLGLYSTAEYYFTGSITNSYYGATDANYDNGVDVYLEQANGGYYLYFKNSSNQKQYINVVASGTYRNFTISSTATSVFTWDSSKNTLKTTVSGDVCYIGNYGQYSSMNILTEAKLQSTDYIARLYTMGGGSQETPGDDPTCQHNYTAVVTAPTCTKEGFTTYTCTLCGDSYIGDKTAVKNHNYVNGTCASCGAAEPSETQATITFDDNRTGRTVFNTSQQVWVQNGITVTNDKASASSNVADYSNPVRFYQGSNVTIAFPGMTKIEINCSGLETKYVDSWLNVTGATATKSNGIVTIVFNAPTDSITFTALAKQSRAYSITVYAEKQSQPPQQCQHTSTAVEGAVTATCTTAGHTGKTICQECGETVAQGKVIPATGHSFTEWKSTTAATCTTVGEERRDCNNCEHFETKEIAVLGHNDANSDGLCDRCNEKLGECKHINTTVEGATKATCTTAGHTGQTRCLACSTIINEGNEIPATGHAMSEWVIIREPTCTKVGLERSDCDNCTYYEKNDIPAHGHADKDEDTLCDVCGTELKVPEETTPETPEETTPETPEETTPETPEETTPETPEETTPETPEENTPETPDDDTTTETEEHVCKEVNGFQAFINKIINFFRRLFGQPELCPCGEVILEKKD